MSFLNQFIELKIAYNNLWLTHNNTSKLPNSIWSIVVDYYSDDPRIVKIISQDQEEQFTTTGDVLEDGSLPDGFCIYHKIKYGCDRTHMRVTHAGSLSWQDSGLSLFQTLLMLPDFPSMSDDMDGCTNAHFALIRDYLYWRLAHPEIPPSPIIFEYGCDYNY